MASVLDAFYVTLGLDPSDFVKGQKQAVESFRKTKEEAAKSGKDVETAADAMSAGLSRAARNVLGLYAAFTSGKSVEAFVANIAAADAALGRFAQGVGAAPSAVSALGMAIERNGGNASSAAAAYQSLSDSLNSLKLTGNGAILPFIGQLSQLGGVAIDISKTVDEQLKAIGADIFNASKKNASMASFLGKQIGLSPDIVQWMQTHSPAQQAADLAESARLGGATAESIKQAQEMARQFAAMRQAAEDLARTVFTDVAPAITAGVRHMKEWYEANRSWIHSGITGAIEAFGKALGGIDWEPFRKLGGDFAKGAEDQFKLLKDFFLGNDEAMLEDWKKFVADLKKYYHDVIAYIGGSGPEMQKAFEKAFTGAFHWFIEQTNQLSRFLYGRDFFTPDGALGDGSQGAGGGHALPGGGGIGLRARRSEAGGGTLSGNEGIRRRGRVSQYQDNTNYTGSNAEVVRQAAKQLGTTPEDLAMVMSYETRGTFSPHIHGGYSARYGKGAYHGLIQFGPDERRTYGASDKQTFAEQMPAVVSYLKSRGFKPGMGILDLYSTINAGRPGQYEKRDINGSVREHVARMQREHAANVRRFLNSGASPSPPTPPSPPPAPVPATPAERPAKQPSYLQTYWQDIQRGAADAMRMSAMTANLTTHHHGPVDNSQTSHTQVGAIHVHTPATDGSTVAADLRRDLQRNGLLGQADYGLA